MYQASPHNGNPTEQINPLPQSTPRSQPEDTKKNETKKEDHDKDKKMFKHIQGSLMVVAVLAAEATYQTGLSPPGGLWQANDEHGHIAGTPVLRDTFPRRYTAFFYCNSTAFIMSLVIIIMLMHRRFYTHLGMIKALKITMTLDMFGFMGAYAAGSCRELSSSIYLFVAMGGVFVYIIWFGQFYGMMRDRIKKVLAQKMCMESMKPTSTKAEP